ncbi:MAG: hypothetical protein JOZ73_12060 [Solirubrobacterales bacterium]|nr:hypothetical protein [Solirubrobacterales bacterium]
MNPIVKVRRLHPDAIIPRYHSDGASGVDLHARAHVARAGVPGVRHRRARPGPENDLVDRFLTDLRLSAPSGVRVTVFREPALLSGFPDLVAVKWHEATASGWATARSTLRDDDIRLLHFLFTRGPVDEAQLRAHCFRRIQRTLEQLIELRLVLHARGKWRAAPLREAFAVRSIIAFEAKISDWASAVEQAALNRWFASESYVLTPRGGPRTSLIEAARVRGVGVWVEGTSRPALRAARDSSRQPVSYASWLFNEWAWRCSLINERRGTPG